MRKRILSIVLLSFIISTAAYSQEPWTLERCIDYALSNNIQVKQQELAVKSNEVNLLQSKMDALPTLNITGNHSYSFGLVTNFLTNTKEALNTQATSFSISTSVPIYNGFQLTNTRKQSKFNLEASVADVEKVKNNIALSVASLYLQILYQEELVELAKKQVEQSRMQLNRTKVLVEAGSLPEGNLYEVEALLASDELQLVNSQNQLTLSYLNLAQLLELKNPEGFKIAKPIIPAIDSLTLSKETPEQIFTISDSIMPEIKSAKLRLQSSEIGVKIAKGSLYPRLSLGANYNTGAQYRILDNYDFSGDPFSTQIKNNASKSIGLSLSIPIFNGLSARSRVTSAKINLLNSKLALDNERNTLFKSIQQAYTDALAAEKKLIASEKNKTASEESFRYTENKFNLGLVTALDYTTAKNKLAKAETELLQAKYELIFKVKILEFYKGLPLKL
ncbi:TolC family protein [Tenuifilum thalassicum]|uniref:TolC family protein n=1 Tax=Tenuifilum thalassicum TaxID=2590900 RepID=A0A7D4C1X1_9BACT|nr:TolC family protein [Tenuifilum thalassicum]QKG81004.1 TolC family protein [Tenuifilum thalassicum]